MTVHNVSIREDDERIETLRNETRPLVQLKPRQGNEETRSSLLSFADDCWIVVPLRQRFSLVGFAILAKPS